MWFRPGLPGLRRGHCEGFERSRSGGAGLVAYRRFCGFSAHAVGVLMNMFAPGAIRFGFGMAVSALLCISVAIVLVESLVHRINGLMGIVIVVSAFGTALPVVFQGELFPAQNGRFSFVFTF